MSEIIENSGDSEVCGENLIENIEDNRGCDGGIGSIFGKNRNSLLFFFLLLIIIFCTCGIFKGSGDSLLFFFLLLVVLFSGRGLFCF